MGVLAFRAPGGAAWGTHQCGGKFTTGARRDELNERQLVAI